MQVEAPFTGVELDTSDLSGTAANVGLGVVGMAVTFGVLAAGKTLWNMAAGETDAIDKVEIL